MRGSCGGGLWDGEPPGENSHVTQGYSPAIGGTERVIQRLSEELVRTYGDEVTAFTTNCFSGEAFYDPQAGGCRLGRKRLPASQSGASLYRPG